MDKNNLVMIVEDRADQAQLLEMILLVNDYDVIWAKNGQEALNLIQDGVSPKVLVTDIGMPLLSGFDLMKKLKEIGLIIPTIITSGHSDNSDFEKAFVSGAKSYLVKPIRPLQFLLKVELAVKHVSTTSQGLS